MVIAELIVSSDLISYRKPNHYDASSDTEIVTELQIEFLQLLPMVRAQVLNLAIH